MPAYFSRYINLVKEEDLLNALEQSRKEIDTIDWVFLKKLGDTVYAPGKWTVKDILQHIIDTERIFTYRALRFARKDTTPLPGYDEEWYGNNANANRRTLEEIKDELSVVRDSSIILFKSFNETALLNKGICFNEEMPVLAIGFVLPGHQTHHLNVIKERYEPLI